MTRFTPLWGQDGSYAASVDRRLPGALWPTAASGGAEVTPTGSGMSVSVAPGSVAVPAANGTGTVLCPWDAPEVVNLNPSPPSGTNRIDLIVCQTAGTDLGLTGATAFTITGVDGSAGQGATPTPPAVPAGAVALAQVRVNGGDASVAAAAITDVRPFGLSLAGSASRPPLAAGAPFQSYTDPSGEVWIAKGGVYGGQWKRASQHLNALVSRATQQTTTNNTVFMCDTPEYDPWGMMNNGGLSNPIPGRYRLIGYIATVSAIVVDSQYGILMNVAGALFYGALLTASANINHGYGYSRDHLLPVNSLCRIQIVCGSGTNINIGAGRALNYLSMAYIGPNP